MEKQEVEVPPQVLARIGGVLYLIIIIFGAILELVVRGGVYVPGDAAATAANLASMESLWRFGIAAELFLGICAIAFGWILYILLKPVSRDLALLATFFNLVAITVDLAYSLHLFEALFPLGNAEYLKAFTPAQLQAMASLSIKAHSYGFGIGLLLFGPFFLIAAYLIVKSGYLPKTIGILYIIPGLSYPASSLALILAPNFANRFYFAIAGPAVIGEAALCLWLLVKGVNIGRWRAHAAASA